MKFKTNKPNALVQSLDTIEKSNGNLTLWLDPKNFN